mgnify:CR=1 FL=1
MTKFLSIIKLCLVSGLSMTLLSCTPPNYRVQSYPASTPPTPSVILYYYPTKGQSNEQQERDRFECYLWAKKQTGYDPSQKQLAPHQRIEIQSATPPGSDTAIGAITGAIIGSVLSRRHDSGKSIVFGAITGAMLGAASEQEKRKQAEQIQQYHNAKETQNYAKIEIQASNSKRAMSACLEGRGYTVG